MDDCFRFYRQFTKGWQRDPPAKIHTNILFGSGKDLTPEFVQQHSITHVINCAFDEHSPIWFRNTFPANYHCIQAIDSNDVDITKWFPEFENCMNDFLQDSSVKTIYVHCQCGINRSGYLCLLYGCKKFHYTFDMMALTILYQRPCSLVNPSFRLQCFEYIKNLQCK
jgi:protein-tyrosine phosphatase